MLNKMISINKLQKSASRGMSKPRVMIALATLCLMAAGYHCDHASHAHGGFGGHSHGRAELDLGLEKDGSLHAEFRLPGATLYGFEHKARTSAEKKKVAQAMDSLTRTLTQTTKLPSAANCAVMWERPVQKRTHGHAEVRVRFKAGCGNLASGDGIRFELSRSFPRLEKLAIRVISDAGNRTYLLEKGDGEIKL